MKETGRSTNRRSASLRTQRSDQERDRVHQAAERARNPVNPMPPVMIRGNMAGSPGSRRRGSTATTPRRKYYYTLSTPGAEVHLPAITMLRPSWRMLSGAISAGLLVLIWAMWSSPFFQVNKISIVGAKRIPQGDLISALNLVGQSVLDANPQNLEQSLSESFPDIAKATVQVGLPATVVVKVVERQPIIAWKGEKDTQWIDASGMAFPTRGDGSELIQVEAKGNPPAPAAATPAPAKDGSSQTATAQVPITGAKPTAQIFLSKDLIAGIQKLSSQAPAGTTIQYDSRYGLGWKDPQGWMVYFGSNVEKMDIKLKQYQVITGELANQKIHPAMISVEFAEAPFYRLEP